MKKKALRTLGILFAAGLLGTLLSAKAEAEPRTEDPAPYEEEISEDGFEDPVGAEPSQLDADYYVENGHYTYSEENVALFSAVYADIRLERQGGRFFTGGEIVSMNGIGSQTPPTIKTKDGAAVTDLNTVSGTADFSVEAIPAEFAEDFSYDFRRRWSDLDEDGNEQLKDMFVTLDKDTLPDRVLLGWEYEEQPDGTWKRISVQRISEYRLSEPSKDCKFDEDHEDPYHLHGHIKYDTSGMSSSENPVAIVAYLYDGSTDDTLFTMDNWDYETRFDGLESADAGNNIGNALYEIEKDSKRFLSKAYDTAPYFRESEMGTFSLRPYVYRMKDDTLTIFGTGVSEMGAMVDYSDYDSYVLHDWVIPANYEVYDPVRNETKEYQVVLSESRHVAGVGEDRGLTWEKYPSTAVNVTIENGVVFPDDCSYLLPADSCTLRSLTIGGAPGTVGSNITNMRGMFYGNGENYIGEGHNIVQLDRLDIAALDTSNVTDMSYMFYGQYVRNGIDVSKFNTRKVKNFSHMFYWIWCPDAKDPDVSGFDTSSAEDMSYMFGAGGMARYRRSGKPSCYGMGHLSGTLDLSNFTFDEVKNMQGMFINQANLKKIVFPNSVNVYFVTDMSRLFMSCEKLEEIENLVYFRTDNVTDMSGMFGRYREEGPFWGGLVSGSAGPALTSLNLANFNMSKVTDASGMLDMEKLTDLELPYEFDLSALEDATDMFVLPKLERFRLPYGMTTGSLKQASGMFTLKGCREFELGSDFDKRLDLSAIEEGGAEGIFDCPLLETLDLRGVKFGENPYALTQSSIVNKDGGLFVGGCKNLQTIYFPAVSVPFESAPELPKLMYDQEANDYQFFPGGNTDTVKLTIENQGIRDARLCAKIWVNGERRLYVNDVTDQGVVLYRRSDMSLPPYEADVSATEPENCELHIKIESNAEDPEYTAEWEIIDEVPDDGDAQNGVIRFGNGETSAEGMYAVGLFTDGIYGTTGYAVVRVKINGMIVIDCPVTVKASSAEVSGNGDYVYLEGKDGNTYLCKKLEDNTVEAVYIKKTSASAYESARTVKKILFDQQLEDEKGNKFYVSKVGSRLCQDYAYIEEIKLGNKVTSIGDYAFYWCTGVTSFDCYATITHIGDHAFEGWKTGSVTIPEGITELGDYAYADCQEASKVRFATAKSGDYAYDETTAEYTLALPDSVTRIGDYCFKGFGTKKANYGVAPGNLFKIDLSNVTDLGEAPFGYVYADELTLSENLERWGNNLLEQDDLAGLRVTSFTVPECITGFGKAALYGNLTLEELNFGENITKIGESAFEEVYGIKRINPTAEEIENGTKYAVHFPNSITEIGEEAFRNFGGRNNGEARPWISGHYTGELVFGDRLIKVGAYAFDGASVDKVVFEGQLETIPDHLFYCEGNWPYSPNVDTIRTIEFKGGVADGKIGDEAFFGLNHLQTVLIPSNITEIGSRAFDQCTELRGIYREGTAVVTYEDKEYTVNGETRSRPMKMVVTDYEDAVDASLEYVTVIGDRAFNECESIFADGNLTLTCAEKVGDDAFYGMHQLKNVSMPLIRELGDGVFGASGSLESLDLGKGANLTKLGSNLFSCEDSMWFEENYLVKTNGYVTGISYNEGLTEIDLSEMPLTEVPEKAFYDSYNLKTVKLPDRVSVIGAEAFSGGYVGDGWYPDYQSDNDRGIKQSFCNRFEGINVDEHGKTNFPYALTVIGDGAFAHSSFTELEIPATVTSIGEGAFEDCLQLTCLSFAGSGLSAIGPKAFKDCRKLLTVDMSESRIKRIGEEAFYGADSLESLIFSDATEVIEDGAFGGEGRTETNLKELNLPASLRRIEAGPYSRGTFLIGHMDAPSYDRLLLPAGFETAAANSFDCRLVEGSVSLQDTDYISLVEIPYTAMNIDGIAFSSIFKELSNAEELENNGNKRYRGLIVYGGSLEDWEKLTSTEAFSEYNWMDYHILYETGWTKKNGRAAYVPYDLSKFVPAFTLDYDPLEDENLKVPPAGTVAKAGNTMYCFGPNGTIVENRALVYQGTVYEQYRITDTNAPEYDAGKIYGNYYPSAGTSTALYFFDENGVGRVIRTFASEEAEDGIYTDPADWDLLFAVKGGVVKRGTSDRASMSQLFIGSDGNVYDAMLNGALITDYRESSETEGTGDDKKTVLYGWEFDTSAKLNWWSRTLDGETTYYKPVENAASVEEALSTASLLSGDYNDKAGQDVHFVDGKPMRVTSVSLYGADEKEELLSAEHIAASEEVKSVVLDSSDSTAEGAKKEYYLRLITTPANPDPDSPVSWTIRTNVPKQAGGNVIKIEEVEGTGNGVHLLKVTAGDPGRARIRANAICYATDGTLLQTYTAEVSVTVTDPYIWPTALSVNSTTGDHTVKTGGKLTLHAAVTPENVTAGDAVTWKSSNVQIASVAADQADDLTAVVTGHREGSAVITAITENRIRAIFEVTVTGSAPSPSPSPSAKPSPSPSPSPVPDDLPVTAIVLNRNEVSLYPGETFRLSASVAPAGARDKSVTFESDDTSVATVSEDGLVTAKWPGVNGDGDPEAASAAITVSANGAPEGDPVTAECIVKVIPKEIVDEDEHGNLIDPDPDQIYEKDADGNITGAKIWVAGLEENYYYTGNAVKPEIHVYKGYKLLTAGTDYTLSYKNNTKVGNKDAVKKGKKVGPQITIRMKGAYTGSETVYFNIIPTPLDQLRVLDGNDPSDETILTAAYKSKKKNQLKPTLLYDGKKIKPGKKDLVFKWYKEGVDEHGDPILTESSCIDPGEYIVKVFAGTSGNFLNVVGEEETGRKVATVKVYEQTNLNTVKINGFKKSLSYKNGEKVEQPDTLTLSGKVNGKKKTLVENTSENPDEPNGDYTVTYENNRELGTATVTYEAVTDSQGEYTGDFCGKIVKTYKITGKIKLTDDSGHSWAVGTSGETFDPSEEGDLPRLGRAPQNGECRITMDVAGEGAPFTNAAIKPGITVRAWVFNNEKYWELRTLKQGKDYTVTWKDNKAVAVADKTKRGKDAAPRAIIKGKGNYEFVTDTGAKTSVVKHFAITPADLSDGEQVLLTLSDVAYNKKKGKYQNTKIFLTDTNYRDLNLKRGKDYTVIYETSDGSQAPAGGQRVKVTITAKQDSNGNFTGNCKGSVTGTYRIIAKAQKDISKAAVLVNPNVKNKSRPCDYTGFAIEPGKSGQPELKLTFGSGKNKRTLVPKSGEGSGDYEILGYFNNVNKGNGVILIRGTGEEFGGVRAVKFKIGAASVKNRWGGLYEAP
ncbi:MAG: leucine-rich repeat protein [Lachnospiraceae bacterium]|nr:leucine-rich repeat protein [Lachnospiraceae bacterium]